MNPSTANIVDAIEREKPSEVVVLPNNGNVIMSAEQAAPSPGTPAPSCPRGRSRRACLRCLPTTRGRRPKRTTRRCGRRSAPWPRRAVTTASRDVELDGLAVREGQYLGLVEEEPVVGGEAFDEVADGRHRGAAFISARHDDGADGRRRSRDRRSASRVVDAASRGGGGRPARRPAALPPAHRCRVALRPRDPGPFQPTSQDGLWMHWHRIGTTQCQALGPV